MIQCKYCFNTRAGKLLRKEKYFLVVACDEPYFRDVYLVIRETEKLNGTWTEDDEKIFRFYCPEENEEFKEIPDFTPHFESYMKLIIDCNKYKGALMRVQEVLKSLKKDL